MEREECSNRDSLRQREEAVAKAGHERVRQIFGCIQTVSLPTFNACSAADHMSFEGDAVLQALCMFFFKSLCDSEGWGLAA